MDWDKIERLREIAEKAEKFLERLLQAVNTKADEHFAAEWET